VVSRLMMNPCPVNTLSSHIRVLVSSGIGCNIFFMDPMCPCVDRCSNTGYIGSIKDEVMCG